eukprot:335015-Prymnesium_polylepis.1
MNVLVWEDPSLDRLFPTLQGGKTNALVIAILAAAGKQVTTTPVNIQGATLQPGVVFGHDLPSRTATPPAPKAGRPHKVTAADLATLLDVPSPAPSSKQMSANGTSSGVAAATPTTEYDPNDPHVIRWAAGGALRNVNSELAAAEKAPSPLPPPLFSPPPAPSQSPSG